VRRYLDLRRGYEGALRLGSGWRYQRPPRYGLGRAKEDMERARALLIPRWEAIFRHPPGTLRPWDNSVTKRHINILGGQGSGKGHTARWIARWIWEAYQRDEARLEMARQDDSPVTLEGGEWGPGLAQALRAIQGEAFNLNQDPWFSAVSDPEDITGLLDRGLDPEAEIQVVFAEDLTSALDKLSRRDQNEAANNWFRIRHKLRDATGHQQGLIIGVLGLHRFHGVPPPFTTDVDMVIFKSLSTNPYDYQVIRSYVGEDGVEFLRMLERERHNDPVFLGYGIWYSRGDTGVWYNPVYPGGDPFKHLPPPLDDMGVTLDGGGHIAPQPKPKVTVGDYVVEPLGATPDPEFREEVLAALPRFMEAKTTEIAQRNVEIMRLTLAGETQNTIAARVGVTPSRVGQIQRHIKASALGYAGEWAYHQRHPDLEYIGGNAHEPDFLDHEGRRVISFKCYHEPALRPNTTWICDRVGKEEMRYSQTHGYQLEMVIYELAQGQFFRYRYHYQGPTEDAPTQEDTP